jgi:SAM-dependent methyltransferase
MLLPAAGERAAQSNSSGYLDVLGAEDDGQPAGGSGVGQALMRTRVLPLIYERWWRPGWGRALKGFTGPGMAEEARIARLMMGLGRGDVVLDVACGPGNFTRQFAHAAGEDGLAIGLDASRTMLDRAVEELHGSNPSNLAYVRGDATAIPFPDSSFDGICCFGALYLIPEPLAALDEMTRVLKQDGRIALMTSVRRQLTIRPLTAIFERSGGVKVFEPGEVTGALADRGFVDIHQRLAGLAQFVGARLA